MTNTNIKFEDITKQTALVAVQGPNAIEKLGSILSIPESFSCLENDIYTYARTGYTGEDGLEVYMDLYRWFTEISGLGLTSQAMKLMHPDPPKREEDIAECLDNWVERVRRLESHGTKYALPPLYNVTAMKLLLVGREKET